MTALGVALTRALEGRFEARILSVQRLSGGDINDAFELGLADGRALFLKTNAESPPGMFGAEAQGLEFLRAAGAVRVPEVLLVSQPAEPPFLVLELLRPAPRKRGFDEELGRALARLHRAFAPGFGLDHDNFIGSLPQSNRSHPSWAEFYWTERLEPQLRRAVAQERATLAMRSGFARLSARLAALVGPPEPPARLHGDLWGGNLHVDSSGAPCLIDPAAYGGQREVDLAMMRLFGGFRPHTFAAYAEEYPLPAGAAERVPLYQLYPLMVHVNLFGGGYAASVESVLARYA